MAQQPAGAVNMSSSAGASAGDALLLRVGDAAAILSVGRTTVYGLIASGQLRPVHVGRSMRISRTEIERFIRELPQ